MKEKLLIKGSLVRVVVPTKLYSKGRLGQIRSVQHNHYNIKFHSHNGYGSETFGVPHNHVLPYTDTNYLIHPDTLEITFLEKKEQVKTEAEERKDTPVYSGVLMYFPDAIKEVARLSKAGNEQHNPGSPLHWDRSKSGDELDAMTRHALEAGTLDTDGMRHSAKVAWRALANLQKEIEKEESK